MYVYTEEADFRLILQDPKEFKDNYKEAEELFNQFRELVKVEVDDNFDI